MVKPQELLNYLESLGIHTQTFHHEALFTVEESRAVKARIQGAHSKNLFVKDKKGQVYALILEGEAVINLKTVHEKIKASGRVSFANEEQLLSLWGVLPGSVTPFGAINDSGLKVKVVLDAALMTQPLLNFHPLLNTMTTSIANHDLVTFLKATGHEPLIVQLSE